MRINLKAVTSAHFVAFLILSSNAATIRVPADQPTIQQAINAASNGDTILVSRGMYLERIDYNGKAITVQGAGLPEETIIDGGNVGAVVTMQTSEGRQSVLAKVTIQHGNESFGAGMGLFGASPTVTGNIFRNNSQGGGGFGAAIGGNISSPLIVGNTFYSNSCDTQSLSGVLGFVNDSSPLIYNNILRDNPCRAINLSLPTGNTPVVANNTILANDVGLRVSLFGSTTLLVSNNIVQGNGVGLDYQGGGSLNWRNNDVVFNNTNYSGIADQTGMNGNISADPLLAPGQWPQPAATSPVIDAGSLSGLSSLPATDFDGRPRVVDGDGNGSVLVDMGAYEYHPDRGDFNADGFTDYLLLNSSTRGTAIWNLHGNAFLSGAYGPTLPVGWTVACVADVNLDGKPDYVLVNATTRRTAVWFLNNAAFRSSVYGPTIPSGWALIAAVDFNSDAKPDYVLFNASTGQTAIWLLDGGVHTGTLSGPTLPSGWRPVDARDFNSNGQPDLLLTNSSTRRSAIWYLNGVALSSSAYGPTLPPGWTLQGTADFNANGKPDYVLFEASTRRTAFWYLNGATFAGSAYGPTLAAGYTLVFP